jgi:hypothetical protein
VPVPGEGETRTDSPVEFSSPIQPLPLPVNPWERFQPSPGLCLLLIDASLLGLCNGDQRGIDLVPFIWRSLLLRAAPFL